MVGKLILPAETHLRIDYKCAYIPFSIKSRADALANLPNPGKVVFPQGRCGQFGNETGRANVSPPRETRRDFYVET
jgi:hypothetical protein